MLCPFFFSCERFQLSQDETSFFSRALDLLTEERAGARVFVEFSTEEMDQVLDSSVSFQNHEKVFEFLCLFLHSFKIMVRFFFLLLRSGIRLVLFLRRWIRCRFLDFVPLIAERLLFLFNCAVGFGVLGFMLAFL